MNMSDMGGIAKTGWQAANPKQPADITGLIPCDPEIQARPPDEKTGANNPAPTGEITAVPENADIPAAAREETVSPDPTNQTPAPSTRELQKNSPDVHSTASKDEADDNSQGTYKKAVEDESGSFLKDPGENEEKENSDVPEKNDLPAAAREDPEPPATEYQSPDPSGDPQKNVSDSPSAAAAAPSDNIPPETSKNSAAGEPVPVLKISDDDLRRIINGTRNDVVLLCSSAKELEGLQRRHEIHLSLQRAALKKGLTDLSEQLSLIETALDGSAPTETGGTENAYGAVLRKVKQLPADLDKGIAAVLGNAQNQVNLYCRQYLSVHKKKEPSLLSRCQPFLGAFFGSLVAMLILGRYLL